MHKQRNCKSTSLKIISYFQLMNVAVIKIYRFTLAQFYLMQPHYTEKIRISKPILMFGKRFQRFTVFIFTAYGLGKCSITDIAFILLHLLNLLRKIGIFGLLPSTFVHNRTIVPNFTRNQQNFRMEIQVNFNPMPCIIKSCIIEIVCDIMTGEFLSFVQK